MSKATWNSSDEYKDRSSYREYGEMVWQWAMGIISSILLIILIIVFFLAIIGLGWETFFQGIKKGVDKIGIMSIIENATSSSTDIIKILQGNNWGFPLNSNRSSHSLFSWIYLHPLPNEANIKRSY